MGRLDSDSHAVLLDGSTVLLRRLDSGDFEEVVGLAETLTEEECYRRFFTLHPADLKAWAWSLTERSSDQYALGAFDSGALVGVANYFTCKPPDYAEVAVVVAHNEHLRGVGTALLPMLQVMSDAGWRFKRRLDGSVLEVDFDLDNVESPQVPQTRAFGL
jgi:hypothetical protein